jgi:hypothetical protein
MLTNQTTQLADSFILHYDAENPPLIKFRGIRNSVLGCCVARGWQGWQVGAVVEIGQELRLFIEKRGRFVLEKLLQVINDTQVDCYAALNDDCKSYLATKIQPSIQAAKGYLEQIRVEANAAIGVTIEASRAFDNLLLGLNAEMDLFCAKYGSKSGLKDQKVKGDNAIFDDQGKDTAGNMIFNINTVQGAVGNISHSPTILNSQNLQNKTSDSPFSENEKQTLEITAKIMSDKSAEPRKSKNPKCVFVVHGRNSALRDSMFAFLRAIGLQPLEWSQAVKATGECRTTIIIHH